MPITLTASAKLELEKDVHENSLIIEIDGYSTIYSSCTLLKKLVYGDVVDYGGTGLFYGGNVPDPNGEDLINLSKSKNSITQQLEQDRGSAQGVTSMDISIVDKSELLSEAFSPDQVVEDPLGHNARVYLSVNNLAHPDDTILLLSGIIQSVEFGCAECKLTIGSPEQKKRATLYEVITTKLDGAIDAAVTTINVINTEGIFEDQDSLSTYIQIEDEIIKVGAISGNSFTGCTRGAFNTIATIHDDDTEVESRYRIQGEAVDLALKMMMSGSGVLVDTYSVQSFIGTYGTNDIIISDKSFFIKTGLVEGDLINSTGATNGANNFTGRTIVEIEDILEGTRIQVSGPQLVLEFTTSATLSFQSKYDVLPQGFELDSRQVDVTQHEFLNSLLAGDFPSYDFFLKEAINGIEWLHSQVYFPVGLYSIPRKGKASCNITLPPLAVNKVYTLDSCNVKNPEKLRIKRSINKYFYNAVVWKYDPDQLEDKYLAGNVTLSQFSKNRIKVQNRPLVINSDGFRDSAGLQNFIGVQTTRFLDRYQFGAESIKVEVLFSVGLPIEVGDAVIFGEGLGVTDITRGNRDFKPRLMECVQKSINLKTCNIEMVLVDTKVGLRARFGVIAPSSPVATGSTTSKLYISDSQTLEEVFNINTERDKWEDYIGSKISVHDKDWNDYEEVTLTGFDTGSDNGLLIDPPLSFAPNNHWVDAPSYPDDTNPKEQFIWKELHVYTDATIEIVSGINQTQFTINAGDLDKVFVGTPVEVHAPDYSYTSTVDPAEGDPLITDITGTTITLSRSIGTTPSPGDIMQLNSFPDEGYPYRYI